LAKVGRTVTGRIRRGGRTFDTCAEFIAAWNQEDIDKWEKKSPGAFLN
jgi:hypothetical protein